MKKIFIFLFFIMSNIFSAETIVQVEDLLGAWNWGKAQNTYEIENSGKYYLGNDESVFFYQKGENDFYFQNFKIKECKPSSNSINLLLDFNTLNSKNEHIVFTIIVHFFDRDSAWIEIDKRSMSSKQFALIGPRIIDGGKNIFYRAKIIDNSNSLKK